jgi:hypothetical protein
MSAALTFTNATILKLRDGLRALDGIPGRPNEIIRFDFDVQTAWNITKNLVLIDRAVATYEMARAKITQTEGVVVGTAVTEANAEMVAAWKAKLDQLRNEGTQDISGLLKIRLKDLQKAGKIPPGVMANLFDLIEE